MNNNELTNMPEVEQVYTGNASDMIGQGATMMQTKSPYSTAVQVIRPRNLELVERRCLMEASIAGEEFYYSWKQGGKIIEGLSVGAAMAIARNMGNNAIDVRVEETPGAYMFYGAYIDLETGFNLCRALRQRKGQNLGEKMKKDGRDEDVTFQIGQSKALRNVVLNAVPNWLAKKVITKAKENVVAKIEKMGPENARVMVINKAKALQIPVERIESIYGLSKGWDIEKLVMLSTSLRSIEDGFESVDSLFPLGESNNSAPNTTPPMNGKDNNPKNDSDMPEVENAKIVTEEPQNKKAQPPAKDEKKVGRQMPNLTEKNPEFIENPQFFIEQILLVTTPDELKLYKKNYGGYINTFGGKDHASIVSAIESKEKSFS